jgi:hypothetical protein
MAEWSDICEQGTCGAGGRRAGPDGYAIATDVAICPYNAMTGPRDQNRPVCASLQPPDIIPIRQRHAVCYPVANRGTSVCI